MGPRSVWSGPEPLARIAPRPGAPFCAARSTTKRARRIRFRASRLTRRPPGSLGRPRPIQRARLARGVFAALKTRHDLCGLRQTEPLRVRVGALAGLRILTPSHAHVPRARPSSGKAGGCLRDSGTGVWMRAEIRNRRSAEFPRCQTLRYSHHRALENPSQQHRVVMAT